MQLQYIGARYVPVWYHNSIDDTSEWEVNVEYEPLTFVTSQNNHLYISKKQVPDNIGTPAQNTEYWLDMGTFSGSYAELQEQIGELGDLTTTAKDNLVDAINENAAAIEELKNETAVTRKYIVICDSYGNHQNSNGRNFYEQAFHDLGITDYYDFHRGSAGFSQAGNLNFLTVLTDNDSIITDKDSITDVIVCGGANDQGVPGNIISGIMAFTSYVRTNYKNAKISIGHFTNSIETTYASNLFSSILEYRKCGGYGATYINNSECIMAPLENFASDNVHPSADGINKLTKYFTDFLVNNTIDVVEEISLSNMFTSNNSNTQLTAQNLKAVQKNSKVTMYAHGAGGALILSAINTNYSLTKGENTFDNYLKVNKGFFYSLSNISNSFMVTFKAGGSNTCGTGMMFARNIQASKDVKVGFYLYSPENASGTITSFTLMMPSTTFDIFQN